MLNILPGWALRAVVWLAGLWPWLGTYLNTAAINSICGKARTRPHPWSTAHDYVSWTSLSNQRYSARHLKADHRTGRPDVAKILPMFARPAGKQVLDAKSTCLFPAFAQYLTDGFIRTRMPDGDEKEDLRKQNTSNHQIDLCPLYGRTPEQTALLREPANGMSRGRLKFQMIEGEMFAPFLFANATDPAPKPEFDKLDPPLGLDKAVQDGRREQIFAFGGDRANSVPQVAMMNTLLLREHNRLADELAARNAGWDDDQVFETARCIVICIFIKLVVEDYINHISPLPFPLKLDAAIAQSAPWNRPNWITTEFSLLYRWHSLMPDTLKIGPTTHPIHTLFFDNRPLIARGVAGLAEDLSAQKAGRLGPLNTTAALLNIEERAIEQDRLVALATYGAYREYVSLGKEEDLKSFEQISSDPAVREILENAYGTPNKVEFYVGLFAEDLMPNSPLPPLILALVALDAFSQALTNPLFSEHVFNETTFTKFGWAEIAGTTTLKQLVDRNSKGGAGAAAITMTQPGWRYTW